MVLKRRVTLRAFSKGLSFLEDLSSLLSFDLWKRKGRGLLISQNILVLKNCFRDFYDCNTSILKHDSMVPSSV